MGETILLRRGTAANLPDLQEGEPGFSTDNKALYVGDNTGTAESASYIGGGVYTDALQYEPNTFTQATIEAALTAIGTTNKVTLLLRPGNWVILTALAFPSNVTVDMPTGAYFTGASVTAATITGIKNATPEMFIVANDPGVTDMADALRAAYIANAATHTPMRLQGVTYKFTKNLPWIYNVDVIGDDKDTTILKKSGNIVGITIGSMAGAGPESNYKNFTLDSAGGVDASTGMEIIYSNRSTFERIVVSNQGNHGINLMGGFFNRFENIRTNANAGDGFRIDGNTGYAAAAANGNTIDGLNTILNVGWGLFINQTTSSYSMGNLCKGIVAEQNTGGGVNVADLNNILEVYAESNTGDDLHFDSTSVRNYAIINHAGAGKITDTGVNNHLLDLAISPVFYIPNIAAPIQSNNSAGKVLNVAGGIAGAGATARAGGAATFAGGAAAGTTGNANGGHVYLQGGTPVNAGEYGNVYVANAGGSFIVGSGSAGIAKMSHGTITLTSDSATTTVTQSLTSATSRIILTPTSATAAVAQGSATGVWVTTRNAGVSFVLTHPNTADADKTFDYIIINP